jgi:hypothetical protein
MGTSQFWSVPYTLYAGSVKGMDTKLNIADTAAMLKPYFNAINLKANIESPTFTGTVKGITKAMVGLGNVDNTSDIDKPVSTATQTALDVKANTADVNTALSLKEDKLNKSIDVTTDAASDTKYPSVKSIKTYVDAQVAGATIADATSIVKGKILLAGDLGGTATAPTVPGLALKANASDVTTALAAKANTADMNTALALKANTSDVTTALAAKADNSFVLSQIASATIADADANTKGKIQLTGDLGGTAGAPTVPGLALKANAADVTAALALKANMTSLSTVATSGDYNDLANKPSIVGSYTLPTASASTLGGIKVGTNLSIDGSGVLSANINSGVINATSLSTGTITATSVNTPIYVSTPQILTDASVIAWDPTLGLNANVTLGGNRTLSFSSTPPSGSYGTIVITQDATGGRSITLPSTSNKVLGSTTTTSIALSTAAGAKDILNFYYDGTNCYWNIGQGYGTAATSASTNLATSVSGILPVANGGTGATTLTGLVKGTGTSAFTAAVAGTDYQEPITLTTTGTGAATFSGNTLNIPAVSSTVNAGSISGTIAVANGGTGATTLNGILKGTGTSALTAAVAGTDYQAPLTLTTTGTGAATLSGTTINIPNSVPYTGANAAVDLGAYNLTVNGLTIGQGKSTGTGENTAVGYQVLNNNSGSKNTGVGSYAANANTTGHDNVGVGYYALKLNSTGNYNTAIGANAAFSANTSNSNYITAVGYYALRDENNTGNTALGAFAGKPASSQYYSKTTNSTFLGYNTTTGKTDPSATEIPIDNATAIGYGAAVTASNLIQLGNTSVTNVKTSGTLTAGDITYPKTHGTANQVLTTTGSGTLTFTTPTVAKPTSDQFTATAAQTSFTLTQTPITNTTLSPNVKPNVWMYINGIRTNNSAYSISGTTVTYTAASNNNYALVVGDRIQFDYAY